MGAMSSIILIYSGVGVKKQLFLEDDLFDNIVDIKMRTPPALHRERFFPDTGSLWRDEVVAWRSAAPQLSGPTLGCHQSHLTLSSSITAAGVTCIA